MRLLRQIKLHFQEGSSDKVYEIDLCEVGPGRHVVNYRFGRRGSRLKEGSQTDAPVSLAEAQKIFDSLAASKIKKGYRETAAAGASASPAAASPARSRSAAHSDKVHYRGLAVLKRLQSPRSDKTWPIERAIWRAGELRLSSAVPALIRLIGTSKDSLRDYCIAWSLGQIGDATAVEPLVRMWRAPGTAPAVRRIAVEALRRLSDPETRAEMARDLTFRASQRDPRRRRARRHKRASRRAARLPCALRSDRKARAAAQGR
jgi:predicted DNA-binding WGR domain protein